MTLDLGSAFSGVATIAGPLGTLVPGGQAIAALAALGVKLTGGGGSEPLYYRPFADPSIAKPFGMFARPAALTPSPKVSKSSTWKLGRLTSHPPKKGRAELRVDFDDVDGHKMPAEWKVPLYKFTAQQAKALASELKYGAAAPALSVVLKALGPKYAHPQLVLPTPPRDAYTHDVADVWTELADIEVAKRLQLEGDDPAFAWWFSPSGDARRTIFHPQLGTFVGWSAREDVLAELLVDGQALTGPALDGSDLKHARDVAANMLARVDAYRIDARQRIAELREFQADVQTFAQQVIDAYQAGTLDTKEWSDFLEEATGAASAQVPPNAGNTSVTLSPSGFPTVPDSGRSLVALGVLAVVALLVVESR